MTESIKWEQQSGGLYLAAMPFDKTNPHHQREAQSVLQNVIEGIAKVHGASFNLSGLRRNMVALNKGDIRLDFFMAKWELCNPHPICLGAALSWPTYGIDQFGEVRKAEYTEDVCLMLGKIRQLLRERPEGAKLPDRGLAECFEDINMRNRQAQDGIFYRFGEVDPNNTKMMRNLAGNGALVGLGEDSGVLEFQTLPSGLMDKVPMDVDIDVQDENNFITRWHDRTHDVRMIVTKGQATALGKPRADIRPWDNGIAPEPEILDCVLASSLLTIKRKIEEKKWGDVVGDGILERALLSPNIPLLGSRREILAALCEACADDLVIAAPNRPRTFDAPMPDAHVHIINNQPTMDAFTRFKAERRKFGDKPMVPGVNVLKLVA